MVIFTEPFLLEQIFTTDFSSTMNNQWHYSAIEIKDSTFTTITILSG